MAKINFRNSEKTAPSHKFVYHAIVIISIWSGIVFFVCAIAVSIRILCDVIQHIINNYFHMSI